MIHRHPMLYHVLCLAFFAIALVLVYLGIILPWSSTARIVIFVLGFFASVISLSYFWVGIQEEQGVF